MAEPQPVKNWLGDLSHGGLGAARSDLCYQTVQDIEGIDPLTCGFGRAGAGPDGAKPCRGDINAKPGEPCVDIHLLVVTGSSPTRWPSKLETAGAAEFDEMPLLKAVLTAAKKAPSGRAAAKVSVVHITEWSAELGTVACRPRPGDMLCFAATPAGASGGVLRKLTPDSAAAAVAAIYAAGSGAAVPGADPLDGRRVCLVCAHRKRDDRCGLCGPVLADLAGQHLRRSHEDGSAGRTALPYGVGKVSHIGGHAFAGNVLVYDSAGLDWFGYVTPPLVPLLLDRQWEPAVRAIWRGRLGRRATELDELLPHTEESAAEGGSARSKPSGGGSSKRWGAGGALMAACGAVALLQGRGGDSQPAAAPQPQQQASGAVSKL
eukprot:TRINITY_DN17957_c0_g2_i1.p1 TRINITY_DN17957_c0_g2~~TRINITY_DN17957_c0_g2_i1.p1  ORF type:complete len:422 (+),score=73.83 TRINITY_DN17957_c0_g2_i1:141-1268(+)